ncbi:hypothetical protein [Hymenobacter metallilatus]|uniref:Uncharacterized protein n=1 Tax=Hymenobacter metallilatus TaxID=2493666 RepID=A0A3R9LWQ2_9BACT|nr:hypothetical protein [Hymenobacter metallilatus]RSK29585.1 hypothetical protein EI290_17100 [Hymenobacter metallilatus]
MSTKIGRYQLNPIFYAGLVWVGVGLFGKHQTTFLILGLLFMVIGLKRIDPPLPEAKPSDDPEGAAETD